MNLALHVTGRRADGYHLLDSIVVFPRIGDRLEAAPAAEGLTLQIDGPFAAGLDAGAGNLVMRAARMMLARGRAASLLLVKELPVAAGLGGGSADAAAAIRLLGRLWGLSAPPEGSLLSLGADVPVCMSAPLPARMRGIGEALDPLKLPPFWLVLANPGVPVPTGSVFAALAASNGGGFGAPLPAPPHPGDAASLAAWLATQRNDLERPAVGIAPPVAEALAALAAQPGCLLARMSGSGATCFGMFAEEAAALAATAALRQARPAWWVAAAPTP